MFPTKAIVGLVVSGPKAGQARLPNHDGFDDK